MLVSKLFQPSVSCMVLPLSPSGLTFRPLAYKDEEASLPPLSLLNVSSMLSMSKFFK